MPLAQRKALCARTIYLEAAQPEKMSLTAEGHEVSFNQLWDNLYRLTEQELARPTDPHPLDSFVVHAAEKLRVISSQATGEHLNNPLEPVISAFEQGARALSCNACSPLRPIVCDGGRDDAHIVAAGGQCIDPFREMFDLAFEVAEIYYSEYSSIFSSVRTNRPAFSTVHYLEKPHDIPAPYFIDAQTTHTLSTGVSGSEVNLRVCVKKFDWPTYMATFYVLMHECICHVFEGSIPQGNIQRSAPPEDAFSEGWMDHVSYIILQDMLSGFGPAATRRSRLKFIEDRSRAANVLHAARNNDEVSDKSEYAARRRIGEVVAERFFDLVRRQSQSPNEAKSTFLRISLDLNLLALVPNDRQIFVYTLYRNLSVPGMPELLPQLEPIPRMLSSCISGKDARLFHEEVVRLGLRQSRVV